MEQCSDFGVRLWINTAHYRGASASQLPRWAEYAIVSGYCQSLVDLFKAVKEEVEEVATLSDHNINEKTAKVFSAVVRMIDMSR